MKVPGIKIQAEWTNKDEFMALIEDVKQKAEVLSETLEALNNFEIEIEVVS